MSTEEGRITFGGGRRPPASNPAEEEKRERIRKRKREWMRKNKERGKEWHKSFKANNPEKIKEYKRQDYVKHREAILGKQRNYLAINATKVKESKKMQRKAAYTILDDFKKSLNNGNCAFSGCQVPWQFCDVDHMRPDLKGAGLAHSETKNLVRNEIERNTVDGVVQLQLLCPSHHRIKSGCKDGKSCGTLAKRQIFTEWKLKHGRCSACSVSVTELPLFCFDADHIHSSDKVECVSAMMGRKKYTPSHVEEELQKCKMLCAACHRMRTAVQFNWRSSAQAPEFIHKFHKETC